MTERLIYLDNAATTKMRHEVFEAMCPYFEEEYGNASAGYRFAGKAAKAVSEARKTTAAFLGAQPREIYFTGGGSESDNWAIKAAAYANRQKGNHIITTAIEHHAVLNTCKFLEQQGFEVTYLDVDAHGLVSPDQVRAALRPGTILLSVMFANNEIGTLEPIREIGEIAKEKGVLFHTDAVQAYGHVPIRVEECHIDMLSASGHKLHGPKGVGILYVRDSVKMDALIHGGAQERGRRAGTLNVPGIVGFAKATELAAAEMEKRAAHERKLRDHLIARVLAEIPYSRLNGAAVEEIPSSRLNGVAATDRRLPNNANFSFPCVEGEALLVLLDQDGICASSGSACTAGSKDPSHVLTAIGLSAEFANGSLRLSLSGETTWEEIDFTVDRLKEIVERLRGMSPQYEAFLKTEVDKNEKFGQQD